MFPRSEYLPRAGTGAAVAFYSEPEPGTREPGGPGGGQLAPNFGAGGHGPSNFLHVATRGIGDDLVYKAFHEGCCNVNKNFAVKS